MTNANRSEDTAGGPVGKLVGKAKAALGSVAGNEELAREGRLQEAQTDAEAEAARRAREAEQHEAQAELEAARNENTEKRERLRAELAEREQAAAAARDRERAQRDAAVHARRQATSAEADRRREQHGADAVDDAAESLGRAEGQDAARLEMEARRAELQADEIERKED